MQDVYAVCCSVSRIDFEWLFGDMVCRRHCNRMAESKSGHGTMIVRGDALGRSHDDVVGYVGGFGMDDET